MSEGRPASSTSHRSHQSHHSSHSYRSGSGTQALSHASGGSRRGSEGGRPTTVVVQDTGTDTFNRYSLMFTGPNGDRHHKVAVKTDKNGYVGEGDRSGETTTNLGYMFRMPNHFPFPKGKHGRLGEIGGEVEVWNIKKGL